MSNRKQGSKDAKNDFTNKKRKKDSEEQDYRFSGDNYSVGSYRSFLCNRSAREKKRRWKMNK